MRHSIRAAIRAVALSVLLVVALSATVTRAEGVHVDEASDEQKAAARKLFIDARIHFDARRFSDALKGFRASHEVVSSPNTRLMIAHSLRELDRNAEAYEELDTVAREAEQAAVKDPKYAGSVESARQEQAQLRPKIGLLTVNVKSDDPDAVLTIGGRTWERSRWGKPVPVDPGTITVALSTSTKSRVKEVTVEAGRETNLRVDLRDEPAPRPKPKPKPEGDTQQGGWTGDTQRIVAYTAGAVGAAAFVVMGVFGGLALKKHGELEDACSDAPCPERQDDIDTGRTYKTVSNAMLVVGIVAVGAGVTLFFTAPADEPAGAQGALVVGPGSLSLWTSF